MIFSIVTIAAFLVAQPGEGIAGGPTVLLNEQQGTVRYSAVFDPVSQQLFGGVEFDYLTEQGVRDYIDFSRQASAQLAHRGIGSVRIKVNFSHPLSREEFETFIKEYKLQVHAYTMRAVERDGTRVTIIGAPDGAELIPQHFFDTAVGDVEERNTAEFQGWIDADVTTAPINLEKMQRDPRIFVTEAAYTLIYDAITPQTLRRLNATDEAIQQAQMPHVVIGAPLYWNLEDLGLVPMPVHSQK